MVGQDNTDTNKMTNNNEKPKLNPKWIQIAKRMNSIARQNDGLTAINISVVADSSGTPHAWWIHSSTPLEPRLEMNITSLEKKLGKEDLQLLLQYILKDVR